MSRRMTLILFLFSFSISAFGQDLPDAGGLSLKIAQPAHIAGVFRYEGTTVAFDSRRVGNEVDFEMIGAEGTSLLHALSDGQKYRVSYLSERASIEGQIGGTPSAEGNVMPAPRATGEPGVLAELIGRPEYRALPHLSRALAVKGIWGTSHPASLYLHGLALAAATRLTIEIRPLESSSTAQCRDQSSDPCRNDCFGMCGKGCNCWNWVCGDCCARKGCLLHDITCRKCDCSIWNVTDCALCYSAISFLGPNPCAGVAETCPIPPRC